MGIYGSAEHLRLGNLCAAAFTDQDAGRRVIVSEDPLTVAGHGGTKSVYPELGHVSITLPADGYYAVGMFLPASTIEQGGEDLRRRMDDLHQRAKNRQAQGQALKRKRLNEGETYRQRYVRLGEGKPGGYGSAGGSAGDHILMLRDAIEHGDGDKVYPT